MPDARQHSVPSRRPRAARSAPALRLVPVIARAVAVFGDEHKATHWLSTPLDLLDHRSPAETLALPRGIARVEQILTRIEHNIPS